MIAIFGFTCLVVSWWLLSLAQRRLNESKALSEESTRLNNASKDMLEKAQWLYEQKGMINATGAGEVRRHMH